MQHCVLITGRPADIKQKEANVQVESSREKHCFPSPSGALQLSRPVSLLSLIILILRMMAPHLIFHLHFEAEPSLTEQALQTVRLVVFLTI